MEGDDASMAFNDDVNHKKVLKLQKNAGSPNSEVYVHVHKVHSPVPPPIEIVRPRQCAGRLNTDSTQSRIVRPS